MSASTKHKPATQPEPIAIVGLGCRLPGASNPRAYWELLCSGGSGITPIPPDRWDADEFYDPDPARPGKMVSRYGGFLERLDMFDAPFFGISPREAAHLDPRQRLIAEVAWEALEDAGVPPLSLAGSRTGVFVAALSDNYGTTIFANHLNIVDLYSGTGNGDSVLANRLSYFLDLRGPSVTINTACSGGLVAIHLACQSLLTGETDLALAGGVSVILRPDDTVFFSKSGALSPDGRCRVFDAGANGTVRSEGAGVVVLKPLARALADGDPVYAVIRSSVVNQDGASSGLMAPNGASQEAMLREAYRRAGVDPALVQYIEAHGTGTPLGDPIEVNALGAVLAPGRTPGQRCALGSAKTNIGHTEAAAGIAGLIKVALAIKHRALPASLHFEQPNPNIPFDQLPLFVQRELGPWPNDAAPLIAGVSAFGFSGTNAHVVLAEPPALPAAPAPEDEGAQLLTISARSPRALDDLARAYQALLRDEQAPTLAALCAAAATRRSPMEYRLAAVAHTREEAAAQLEAALTGETRPGLVRSARRVARRPRMVFVFSGQGSHWLGMGRELLEREPAFRAAFERCEALIAQHAGYTLRDALAEPTDERLNQTDVAQPAIFAVQVALAALWRSWGVEPDAVVGQSLGEVAAAHVAGALDLEDAVRVIVHRSRLMKRVAGQGQTAVVGLPLEQARLALTGWEDLLAVAGSSSPSSCVLSGDPAALGRILRSLEGRGIFCRLIKGVDIAFHSPHMDPLVDELVGALASIAPRTPAIPIFSTVTGRLADGPFDAAYWGRNLRDPFLLSDAVAGLVGEGYEVFLEVSPHPVAVASLNECLGQQAQALPSLRRGEPERALLLGTLGALWAAGLPVDWRRIYPPASPAGLPCYPWQRERFWYDQLTEGKEPFGFRPATARRDRTHKAAGGHPLLGEHAALAFPAGVHTWEMDLNTSTLHYLDQHRVQGMVLLPGSAFIEMALAAAAQVYSGEPVAVEEIAFRQALMLSEQSSRRIQVSLADEGSGAAAFRVFSAPAGAQREQWTLHASGRLQRVAPAEAGAAEPLKAIQDRCAHVVPGASHYQMMEAHGQSYGPCFQAVSQVWRRSGEAIGLLDVPAALRGEIGRYALHPAVLDACFQVGVLTLPMGDEDNGGAPVRGGVVHSVGRLAVHGSLGQQVWCHARLRPRPPEQPDAIEIDIELRDAAGACVATVEALRLQALEQSRAVHANPGSWLLDLCWQPAERAAGEPAPAGGWIIFADRSGLGARLASGIRARGLRATLVTAGASSRRIDDDLYEADPADAGALGRLVAELAEQPYTGVLHLWLLDTPPGGEPAEALGLGTGALLPVVQALAGVSTHAAPRLWMVTRGSQQVGAEPQATAAAQAPVWGFGRVLANEHPELWGGLIDLDHTPASGEAALLLEELLAPDSERQLAFRQGARYVARLARAAALAQAAPRFRPDGSYLISGGLSGLGLEVARWMVANGARRLVLLARTTLPPRAAWGNLAADDPAAERVAAVRALEAEGASVHVAAVDVGDAAALEAFLAAYRAEGWPPIRGVVHSAGIVRDQLLTRMRAEDFAAVLRPKIDGAWLLHRLLIDEPLDFFVLFSSASALMGMYGQSNYAAGNAFLDSLAHHRRALGLPATSINWGAWAEVGMAARLASSDHLASGGVVAMPPAQALELLGRLMHGPAQAAVMAMDWAAWRRANPFAERIPFFAPIIAELQQADSRTPAEQADAGLAAALRNAAPAEQAALVHDYVLDLIGGVLRLDRARVDLDQPLNTMGIDSIMAVEIKNRLEAQLRVTFSIVELLQGASGTDLAARISAEYHRDEVVDELLDELDQLSDDEIAALLAA
ncbi:MAG TPA: type I polyketide synthase [Roseiflexaceae bacterium]|nr:type I polyketide synthase [Roseiflexaceae bacterium]